MIHAEFISASLQSGPGSAPYHHFHPFTRSTIDFSLQLHYAKECQFTPTLPSPTWRLCRKGLREDGTDKRIPKL